MCNKDEEHFIFLQFLRFGETRPIAQQILLQGQQQHAMALEAEQRARAHMEFKKLVEKNRGASSPPTSHPQHHHHHGQHHPPVNGSGQHNIFSTIESLSKSGIEHSPGRKSSVTPPPSRSPIVSSGAAAGGSPVSAVNGNNSSSSTSSSPLNRLQSMQPFDYRASKESGHGSPDSVASSLHQQDHQQGRASTGSMERPVPATISPSMRLPPSSGGMPLLASSVPASLASYHNTINSIANKVS